jgi:hypothetical protein
MTVKEVWDSKNEEGRELESMKGLQLILVASEPVAEPYYRLS